MTLSLRRRILVSVTPLVLLIVILGGVGAGLLVQLGRRSNEILRENYDSVRAMSRLNEAVERIDSSFQFALAGQEALARTAYRDNWTPYREQLEFEVGNITIYPEEPHLVEELQRLTAEFEKRGDAFFALRAGDARRREDYFGNETRPGLLVIFTSIKRTSSAIRDLNESEMTRASHTAQTTARLSVFGFGLGVAASVLLAVAAVWWLQRSILEPIRAVTEAATAIGGGQLHLIVPTPSNDEMSQLARAFNGMTEKLRAYRQTNTERLLRARQTGQATIDSFSDPVIVLDLEGKVESANPAAQRLLGVEPPRTFDPPTHWQPPESLRPAVEEALRQQRSLVTESFDQALTFRLEGAEHQFLPQVRPIRSSSGETLGAAILMHDVTQFRLLDRLKSDWVATVSHELQTPLTSVRLAVHVLLEEVVGPLEPKQIELLVEARENTERLLRLIQQLLALAKLEDSRNQLDLRATDASTLLRTAVEGAHSRAEDRRIDLVVEEDSELPRVLVDSVRLGHALNNLLDNALTYTEPGGKVTLRSERLPTGRVRISVSDTGIGIPTEALPHVFDRFYRVPGRDRAPGTGLGLAIVREIVTAHQGDIICDSKPDRGTTFHITLPAAKDEG